jgi:hypothetical protein
MSGLSSTLQPGLTDERLSKKRKRFIARFAASVDFASSAGRTGKKCRNSAPSESCDDRFTLGANKNTPYRHSIVRT